MENITYEQIEKANKVIRTTDIKGKDYAEVNQRIKAFRMCYPSGRIETEIKTLDSGVVIMQAKVYDSNDRLIGTGLAQEKENSSFINKTSFIENCETSAVGRALGMCGFGIDVSVASAEEVQNAINNQKPSNATSKCTSEQVEILKAHYVGEDLKKLLKVNRVSKLEDMPKDKATDLISKIMEIQERRKMMEEAEMYEHEDAGDRI